MRGRHVQQDRSRQKAAAPVPEHTPAALAQAVFSRSCLLFHEFPILYEYVRCNRIVLFHLSLIMRVIIFKGKLMHCLGLSPNPFQDS